jgi:hypothetical protein
MTQLNGGLGQLVNQDEPLLPEKACLARGQRMAARSRMNREVHVRICEGLGVKFPGATRPAAPGMPTCPALSPYDLTRPETERSFLAYRVEMVPKAGDSHDAVARSW